MNDFVNAGISVGILRERFLDLRTGGEGILVARCPQVHDGNMEGVFHAVEMDDGFRLEACDLGCMPVAIWESSGFGRRVPGEDDDAKPTQQPVKERNKFIASYTRFSIEELDSAPPPLQYVLKPQVPAVAVSVLSAPGGAGKTTLMTLMAVSRALNRSMFRGVLPRDGETVILATEDRKLNYHHKLAALRDHLGHEFDSSLIAERVHFFDMAGQMVRLIVPDRGQQYRPSDEVDELADAILSKAPKADHIIIETISRVAGGVESNESMSVLVSACERLTMLVKAAVTLVGHVSQNMARSGLADAYAARGGSSLGDNARSSMVLMPLTDANREKYASGLEMTQEDVEQTVVWTHEKANGPIARPHLLRRQMTNYGPVLVDVDYDRAESTEKGKKVPGRKANRTYEQTCKAIVDYVTAKQPAAGNAVAHDLGGTRGHILTAITDLVTQQILGRDEGGRLVVRITSSESKSNSNRDPAEPPVRIPPLPLSLQRGRGTGDSVPDGSGSSASVPTNRTVPKDKGPF